MSEQKSRSAGLSYSAYKEKNFEGSSAVYDYKSLSFFLERTAESIYKTTVIVQQLESEVARLKYEVMATENEYKNLCSLASDLEIASSKSTDLECVNK